MKANQLIMKKAFLFCFTFLLFFSCTNSEKAKEKEIKKKNTKAEYILRHHNTYFFPIYKPAFQKRELYPWEEGVVGNLSKITKEFLRCRGSSLNPPIFDNSNPDKPITYEDCGGATKHSLPMIHGKEGIYPVLIDLLNYLQRKTRKKVVITCGHRCPAHNKYADQSNQNRTSKHMIGAEVDFYVQGLEDNPEQVIDLIFQFYREDKAYIGKKEHETFYRYEKSDSNVSTMPWFNKEIFIKLFKKDEGRDFDNRHPYSYISIQVRYDRDTKEKVVYSWDKATSGYLRW